MNSKVVLVFLTIVGITIADSVLDLTDDDFSSLIDDINAVLVMFYDPWSKEYPMQNQELQKASESLRGKNQPFALAKVNCRENGKNTCLKYITEIEAVEYFPIMKIFRMGKLTQDYGGPEDSAGIAKFMTSRYGVESTELFTLTEMEEFLNVQEPAVIAFLENDKAIETLFFKFAQHFIGDYRFGHSSATEILSKYNEKNSIVLFRAPHFHNKFEPSSLTFKGSSQDELTNFIKTNWHGLVGHRKPDNIEDFKHPNVIAYYTVDYVNNAKKTNYWRNRILQVAKDNTDYKFAISSGNDFRSELENFGVSYLGEKLLIVAHDKDGRKFKMTAEFSIENLKQFVSDLKQGKLESYMRSEAIPTTNDEPVKIAVARNFDEIVINNGRDTFLEIYAPWCGYCKDIAPVFDELGAEMIDEEVEIVKFDGTNNEVPKGFDLQGYPTFFWLPKDSKDRPVMYNDGKNLKSFIKFIAKHSANKLKKYDRNGEITKTEL